MATSQPISPKYVIRASFEVEGVVERSDVVGALFGQTEGLFGPELDLHELQKSGRIGRIEIRVKSNKDKTNGVITVPSSLDKPLTALIAAAIENVDRVGPCSARVSLDKIEDIRVVRRDSIVNRAKEILHNWTVETASTVDHIAEDIYDSIKPPDITLFGPDKLSAGPDINSRSIVVVEGRADVANLLRSGVKNVIACQGTNIPASLIKKIKGKEVTVLLDGDRGGDIILEALLRVTNVKFVARAPRGKEVEELTPRQIINILEKKTPIEKVREERDKVEKKTPIEKVREERDKGPSRVEVVPDKIVTIASELKGTLEAIILDEKMEQIDKMPVSELAGKLKEIENADTVVFDGIITQRLVDIGVDKGLKKIIGERISGIAKRPVNIQLLTTDEIVNTATE